jgi:hypothetical protein
MPNLSHNFVQKFGGGNFPLMLNLRPNELDYEQDRPIDPWEGPGHGKKSPSIGPEIIADYERAWERLKCLPPQWRAGSPSVDLERIFRATFKIVLAAVIALVVLFV